MYEFAREIAMSGGSASSFPNNISTFFHEGKNLTFTAMAHKYQVNMVHWDSKLEGFTSDQIQVKEPSTDKPLIVVQAKYVLVSNRSFPLLAVASTGGAMVFDPNNGKMLAYTALPKEDDQTMRFVRGISYVDNLIMMGTHTGEILIFNCSGESSVKPKPTLKEHTVPIVDIATCHFDDLTCTCDVDGHVIVWSKNMKSTTKKIKTEQTITCINVLRKQVICGTVLGQVLFYATQTGEMMAEVNAHCRPVTSIAVAPESAYVMTAGEDTFIRIWKLHTRKPEAYEVEWRHSEAVENAPLVGAQFINGRGSGFIVSAFDHAKLYYYKIAKKPA